MNLDFTEDQNLLRDSFARLLDDLSHTDARRQAELTGIDRQLWLNLAEMGTFAMRVPEQFGGMDLGTFDVAILMEEVGRTLATGPIVETLLVARLIALLAGEAEQSTLDALLQGQAIATLAPRDGAKKLKQWCSGGAHADLIVARLSDEIVLYEVTTADRTHEPTLAGNGLGEIDLSGLSGRVLGCGPHAVNLFRKTIEEWKLLTAATLAGLSREALRLAANYACERKQFGVPIGSFQAISHPLADLLTQVEGGKLLTWKVIHHIAKLQNPDEEEYRQLAAMISLVTWWNIDTAARAVAQALHTFGGYGLTTEYDIHRYNLRAKAIPLVWGDPQHLLQEGAGRRYGDVPVVLPDVGAVAIHFELGEQAEQLAQELDDFFKRHLTPELKQKAHYSWDGHDPKIHQQLATAGLLFPGWPVEFGGRGASPYAQNAMARVWEKHGWGSHAANTTALVGLIMHRYASATLKREVLSKIAAGEVICSLGYSEPGSGSDVFAAQCRAVRDGDDWVINGTKMFTSGANLADYVLLLTRTTVDVPKHQGLTMFLVPLKARGVSVQPVYTFQDERTNITFYDDVRISDDYRLGDVDGGVKVMSAGLELEHGGGFAKHQFALLHAAEQLCRELMGDKVPLIHHPDTQQRLARAWLHAELADVIANRALWASEKRMPNKGFGPMAKLFSSEMFLCDARDLLDLTAPDSLAKREGPARFINQCYRHAQGTTIYGGTSEIHRSQIAERALGLPRTR